MDHPRIAMLPFENLSGREDQGRHFTQAFFAVLAGSGAADVVDLGTVEVTVEELRIRTPASPSREQLAMLGESLQVRYVLLGSVLESRMIRTADGETPAAGVALRLVETTTARIAWAAVRVKTGDEHESVFGWGRENSEERLITTLAEEMLEPFEYAGDAWRKRTTTTSEVAK
jgi:TolB-like protein